MARKLSSEVITGTIDLLESVSDTALVGAGANPEARRMIVLGSLLSGVGAITLLIGGTVIALEAGASATVILGTITLFKGLLMGYKTGKQMNKSREVAVIQLTEILAKSDKDTEQLTNVLKSILITPTAQNAIG